MKEYCSMCDKLVDAEHVRHCPVCKDILCENCTNSDSVCNNCLEYDTTGINVNSWRTVNKTN